jgi:WSC domain
MNWPANFFPAAGPLLPYMMQCEAVNSPASHCFPDEIGPGRTRVLPHTVTINSPYNSREWCAMACAQLGFLWAGVEFSVACFCSNTLPAMAELPASACANMSCAGAPSEGCGASDVISVYPAQCVPASDLPPGLLPPRTFQGAPRLYPSVARTTVASSESSLVYRE